MKDPIIDSILNATPTTAGQLACSAHMSRSHELEIPLPSNWSGRLEQIENGYEIADGKLVFASQRDRNKILADEIYLKFLTIDDINPPELFATAQNLWKNEIRQSDYVSGRLLANLAKEIDVLQLAAQRILDGNDIFDVLHVLDAYFHYAENLNIKSLFDLTRAQHDGTKNDVFSGVLYRSIERWLITNPAVARDLYVSAIADADEITANLVNIALLGLAKSQPDEAVSLSINLISSEVKFLQRVGRWACGRLLLEKNISAQCCAEIEKIILQGIHDEDADVRGESIRAATGAMHLSPIFDEALAERALKEEKAVLESIANALFLKSDDLLKEGRFFSWLPLIVPLGPSSSDTLGNLDHVIAPQLDKGNKNYADVMVFLDSWILRHGGRTSINDIFPKQFDRCILRLARRPHRLTAVLTSWLSSDKREHGAAVAGVLSSLVVRGVHRVYLDVDQLNAMELPELQYLARRVCGFVHDAECLISLSLSFLQMDESNLGRALPLIRSLIVDEVGYDYPSSTLKALQLSREEESRPIVRSALRAWQEALESSKKAWEQLPRRNELRASSKLERQFAIARDKEMERARDRASEESILRQIATNIPLKAGVGFFNHRRGEFSEPSKLQTLTYSVELPQREVLDPVGNAIRGFNFRTSRKRAL